jgi:hypothetical protein
LKIQQEDAVIRSPGYKRSDTPITPLIHRA